MLAVSSAVTVLAVIGLVVGLVVLGVVIFLLQGVLSPLLAILADLKSAKTAPMLERGVPGTDQLGTTRRLADSVPPLALAYLNKLSLAPRAAPPTATWTPPPATWTPPSAATPAPPPAADDPTLPAWKRYRG